MLWGGAHKNGIYYTNGFYCASTPHIDPAAIRIVFVLNLLHFGSNCFKPSPFLVKWQGGRRAPPSSSSVSLPPSLRVSKIRCSIPFVAITELPDPHAMPSPAIVAKVLASQTWTLREEGRKVGRTGKTDEKYQRSPLKSFVETRQGGSMKEKQILSL